MGKKRAKYQEGDEEETKKEKKKGKKKKGWNEAAIFLHVIDVLCGRMRGWANR